MSDQIEREMFVSDGGDEPLPVATNDSPGVASFSSDDFLVDPNGKVEALTKLGIAFILAYSGDDAYGHNYIVINTLGKQALLPGAVGLVLGNAAYPDNIGDIVKITYVLDPNPYPQKIVRGEVLGSILGPQGARGPQGETGAIQHVAYGSSSYQTVNLSFTKDGLLHVGDLCLICSNSTDSLTGNIIRIKKFEGQNITDWDTYGNIRGPQGLNGHSIVQGFVTRVTKNTSGRWIILDWNVADRQVLNGDLIIATKSFSDHGVTVQPGDIYSVYQALTGTVMTYSTPVISKSSMQLGIWSVHDATEIDDEKLSWNYYDIFPNQAYPLVGNIALCTDDHDTKFANLYIIEGVIDDDSTGTRITKIITSKEGVSIKGPAINLVPGTITTIPNVEGGLPGEATAEIIDEGSQVKLNLGLPAGPQGPQGIEGKTGPQGPKGEAGVANVTSRGDYDPTATYNHNDLVFFEDEYTPKNQGASYICNTDGVIGETPITSPEKWGFFVAEGAPGKDGAPGPVGPVGPVGPQGEQGATGATGENGRGITRIENTGTSQGEGFTITHVTATMTDDTEEHFDVQAADGKFSVVTVSLSKTDTMGTFTPDDMKKLQSDSCDIIVYRVDNTDPNMTEKEYYKLFHRKAGGHSVYIYVGETANDFSLMPTIKLLDLNPVFRAFTIYNYETGHSLYKHNVTFNFAIEDGTDYNLYFTAINNDISPITDATFRDKLNIPTFEKSSAGHFVGAGYPIFVEYEEYGIKYVHTGFGYGAWGGQYYYTLQGEEENVGSRQITKYTIDDYVTKLI